MAWLVWVVLIGLVAGWLAGKVMKGRGFGVPINIVIGIAGGMLGRFIFGILGLMPFSLTGSIFVSFVGAIILIWLAQKLK